MENLLFSVQTIYLEAVRVRRMNRASLPCQPEPGYSFTRCVQHSVSQVEGKILHILPGLLLSCFVECGVPGRVGGRIDVSVLEVRTDLALSLGCSQLEDERPRLVVGG